MLSKQHRFHGHGSLNYLFRNGQSARGAFLQVRYVYNKRRSDSRVAVIVGKKVAKSAVVRNRIRRRVFEVVRRHMDNITPHTDMALTVFSAELAVLPASEVERAVQTCLQRAQLYRTETVSDIVE